MSKASSAKGAPAVAVRASSRTHVLSKFFLKVDAETRREFREKRLLLLEADNYTEEIDLSNENDEEYSDESDDEEKAVKKKSKKAKIKSNTSGNVGFKVKWALKKVKPLERILVEHGYYVSDMIGDDVMDVDDNTNTVSKKQSNYVTATANPSLLPTRYFCSVCGQGGIYSCTRCGMRSCSIKCTDQHKETRCMKMGAF